MDTNVLGIRFKNPIVVASTDIGRSPEKFRAFAKAGVGGIITKSVTDAAALQQSGISMIHIMDMEQKPVEGELPDCYSFFSRGGSMLPMQEFEEEAEELLKIGREYDTVVIGSISASRTENWVAYAKRFEEMGFPAIELNFGNPHGEAADGKLGFLIGQSKELCVEIASKVLAAVHIPVIVKLTPQIADIAGTAKLLEESGVQAVTITHRFQGLVLDPETDRPILGGWAAIGGPWMKPISLANVARVRRNTNLTILGSNGVDTARDVYDYMLAGASLVQVGSSMMLRGPGYAARLVEELEALRKKKNVSDWKDVVGAAAGQIVTYKSLSDLPARRPEIDTALCEECHNKPCLDTCYFGGLSMGSDGTLSHDDEACSGCGLCQHICPKGAVAMKQMN